MSFGEQALKGEAGGVLLSLLLSGSFRFGEGARAALFILDADFHPEALLMVWAALVGKDVVGLASSGGLEVFLKSGFVVADRPAEGVARLKGEMKIGKRRLDNMFFDEGAGGDESTIEVERGDDSLEGIGEKSGFSAATALFFTATETKERAEVDASGNLAEMTATDERGTEACEFTFARVGKAPEERFGDGQTEDCVADEL